MQVKHWWHQLLKRGETLIIIRHSRLHRHLNYIVRVVLVLGLEDKVGEGADKDEDAVEGEGDEEEVEVAVVPLP